MTDMEILAADAVRIVGALGLGCLVILNGGGLAVALSIHSAAAGAFLWGTMAALCGILVSYLLGCLLVSYRDPAGFSGVTIITLQLLAPAVSAFLFFAGAMSAIQSLN